MDSTPHLNTNQHKVLQCIVDLHNARRPAARPLVGQLLTMKLSVVDEAVKALKEEGLIRTVVPGIFEPVAQHPPPRAISRTTLPDGCSKVEVGDDMLTVTPHEAQLLGVMFAGDASQLHTWTEERRVGESVVRLEAQVRAQGKQIAQLLRALARAQRPGAGQPDLFTEPGESGLPRRRGPHVPA